MRHFADFLREQAGIGLEKLPYYLGWVDMFRAFLARLGKTDADSRRTGGAGSPSTVNGRPVPKPAAPVLDESAYFEAFLRRLAGTKEDWQVDQARDALRLYWYHRCAKPMDARGCSADGHRHSGDAAEQSVPAGPLPPRRFLREPVQPERPAAAAPPATPSTGFAVSGGLSVPCQTSAETSVTWDGLEATLVRLMRLKHLSYRTEKTYLAWVGRFKAFNRGRALRSVTQDDLKSFLSHLAVERHVSPSTQKQAFNALLFLFRNVLFLEVTDLRAVVPSRVPRRLPVVLTPEEVRSILDRMAGTNALMARVIYGSGLRLNECLSLRVKDIDFARNCLCVRSGKGGKDRETVFPRRAARELKGHLQRVRRLYEEDRRQGIAGVSIPAALERKYPNAGTQWGWFWAFPSARLSIDPLSRTVRRYHLYPTTLQKAFHTAVKSAGVDKPASLHSLRQHAGSLIMPSRGAGFVRRFA